MISETYDLWRKTRRRSVAKVRSLAEATEWMEAVKLWKCVVLPCFCHLIHLFLVDMFVLTAFLRFSRYEKDEGKVENVENVEPKNANAARWANDARHSPSSAKEAPQPQGAPRGVPPVPLGANGRCHTDPSNLRGEIRSKMLREPADIWRIMNCL